MWSSVWAAALSIGLAGAPGARPAQSAAAAAWPDDRPITGMFKNLWKDARALPTSRSLVTLAAGSGVTAVARVADADVAAWAARQPPPSHTRVGDVLGGGAAQGITALGTYVTGKLARHAPTTHVGSDLIRAQLLTSGITHGLKAAVGRTRPNGSPRSFPSGHTSATFVTAAVLGEHFGWKAGLPALAAASYVGWTRVRDHVHYPSDVLFGATIGILVTRSVTHGHRARTWTVVPAKTAGGMAIYVVKTR